jgi:hypothetical protein
MSPFLGGSAAGMAEQVAGGYTALTSVHLKRLTNDEIHQLKFELERILRDLRAEALAAEDFQALQARNRKISRITGAMQQIQAAKARRG